MAQRELQERQKAVMEAGQKVDETKQRIQQTLQRGRAQNVEGQRSMLTHKELSTLDNDATTYKAVGRMFVQRPRDSLMTELAARQKACQEEVTKAEEVLAKLQDTQRGQEAEFNNLLKQFREEMQLFEKQQQKKD